MMIIAIFGDCPAAYVTQRAAMQVLYIGGKEVVLGSQQVFDREPVFFGVKLQIDNPHSVICDQILDNGYLAALRINFCNIDRFHAKLR